MEFISVSEHCHYFKSAVNIGYVFKDGKGMLIDAGLEKSTAKKVLKHLIKKELPIHYLILTHAHADHYGGAAYIKKEARAEVFAPPLEAAIMENPLLEPIYLWNGAYPIKTLRNKFLEGEPVQVDGLLDFGEQSIGPFQIKAIHLPGHSYGQCGVLIEDIFYAADSYFGVEVLRKHKVPFIVDANAAIASLEKVLRLSCSGFVPGHGEFEKDPAHTIRANMECHYNVKEFIFDQINHVPSGVSLDTLQQEMFGHFGLAAGEPGQWLLYRTSFTAYISSLIEDGKAGLIVKDNKLWLLSSHENSLDLL
ncbi:MBL fold metallo-hydrolase [Siminovitchia sp. 179-K 8D1 HS]|uniref:MBL fold metallo-hydrolase n=1 Tax=Siminovitchia sp. 179-K 8D1 HS TaxID=3142385 RepID=UPI0039A2474B